jgi:hypothetical protein
VIILAIKYIPKFHEYIGESTDDKSIIATDGSIIYYTDTKKREVYNNGEWTEYLVNVDADIQVGDIQIEAVSIKDGDSENKVTVDEEGNLAVQNTNKYEDIVFHDESDSPNGGLEFEVKGYKNLRISVDGTATSFELVFKGQVGDVVDDLTGIESVSYELKTSTTTIDKIYEFDIEGYEKIWFGLPEVEGGNITVVGRVVN